MQEALNQKIDAFVAANKEQILKDIATLVSINSVEGAPEEGAPYGAGPRCLVAGIARIDGFQHPADSEVVFPVLVEQDVTSLQSGFREVIN